LKRRFSAPFDAFCNFIFGILFKILGEKNPLTGLFQLHKNKREVVEKWQK